MNGEKMWWTWPLSSGRHGWSSTDSAELGFSLCCLVWSWLRPLGQESITLCQGNLLKGIDEKTSRREDTEHIKRVFTYVLFLITHYNKETKWLEITVFFTTNFFQKWFLGMTNNVCKKWFLFQIEMTKNCYWIYCLPYSPEF